MKCIINEVYFRKAMIIKKKWQNSDIVDESILKKKGVNLLIPIDQHDKNIYCKVEMDGNFSA